MTPRRFRSQADLFAEQPGLCVARLPLCAVVVIRLMQIEGDWGFRLRNAPRRGLARIRRTSGFFMSAVVNFSSALNELAEVVSLASQGWGVVKSLELIGSGPVGLVHTQKIEAQSEKPTWTKALEFTQFACPCGTDPRLLSGEQRTSHFKLVTSVDDPYRKSVSKSWCAWEYAIWPSTVGRYRIHSADRMPRGSIERFEAT